MSATRYDETRAECLVFTFKEGLLAKAAHDLLLKVTRFWVELDASQGSLSAELDARSLRVQNALKNGREDASLLSAADKSKIEQHIVSDVLEAERYPKISFAARKLTPARGGGFDIEGDLTLHGVTQSIRAASRREGAQQVAELRLNQPDYGITPYKAMLGALKVQPEVRLRFSLPHD